MISLSMSQLYNLTKCIRMKNDNGKRYHKKIINRSMYISIENKNGRQHPKKKYISLQSVT